MYRRARDLDEDKKMKIPKKINYITLRKKLLKQDKKKMICFDI